MGVVETIAGLVLLVGAYFVGSAQGVNPDDQKKFEQFNPQACAIMCEQVKKYDALRQKCECK